MPEKPNGGSITLREQIIEDPVSGLTIQIERCDDGEGRVRLWGNIPFGNRDLAFDQEGRHVGAGTALRYCHRPSWLKVVS